MDINKETIFYRDNLTHIHKCHVVMMLENEENPQVVFKYFGKYKQWWHYEIESMFSFNLCIDNGRYAFKIKNLGTKKIKPSDLIV